MFKIKLSQYYCEQCWASIHSRPGREFHKPLVKEGADRLVFPSIVFVFVHLCLCLYLYLHLYLYLYLCLWPPHRALPELLSRAQLRGFACLGVQPNVQDRPMCRATKWPRHTKPNDLDKVRPRKGPV